MPRTSKMVKTDDLIAGASFLLAAAYLLSVTKNINLAIKGGGVPDFSGWGNVYALSLGILTVAWSWYTRGRLRFITVAAIVMIATAAYIWLSLR